MTTTNTVGEIQRRLDALPEGWGSTEFREALLARARATVPRRELEEAIASSRAATQAAIERGDVAAAISAKATLTAAEALLPTWKTPSVDETPIRREVDAAVQQVAELGSNLPDLVDLADVRDEHLDPPTRTLMNELRSFLGDLKHYAQHRHQTDPIQMLSVAADLTRRRTDFDQPIVGAIHRANTRLVGSSRPT